jgi:hypothetical protein
MRIKRKIPSFVFGVSVGLIIGIAFFLFKVDDIFSNLKNSISANKITVIEKKGESYETREKARNKERFKIITKYSSKVNYREVDSLINADDDINLAVDKLISSREIKLINLSETSSSDTIAKRLAGVNSRESDSYFLEFWRTPLNSKGYRFMKNKIMLYGFVDHSNILLYSFQGKYYIKSFEVVYELQNISEFMPFVKVSNTELLSKLDS